MRFEWHTGEWHAGEWHAGPTTGRLAPRFQVMLPSYAPFRFDACGTSFRRSRAQPEARF